MRELAELEEVASAIREWRKAQEDLEGVNVMLADPALDKDMRELAETELPDAMERIEALEKHFRGHLSALTRDSSPKAS